LSIPLAQNQNNIPEAIRKTISSLVAPGRHISSAPARASHSLHPSPPHRSASASNQHAWPRRRAPSTVEHAGEELGHPRGCLSLARPLVQSRYSTSSPTLPAPVLALLNFCFPSCSERRHLVRFLGIGVGSRARPAPGRVPREMEWLAAQPLYNANTMDQIM
jgi:hypothetical protein